MANEKKISVFFPPVKWLVRMVYKKLKLKGIENIPENNAIIVGNHSHMNGPLASELYLPENTYTWCAHEMLNLREVPTYAFKDFWSKKPKWTHPFYKLLSFIIAPLSVFVFGNAKTIGIYHDTRVVGTFKETVKLLKENKNIVIFPEHYAEHNQIIHDFQEGFLDIARLYYKRTGVKLNFVPMYVCPALGEVHFGAPTKFNPDADYGEERARIKAYLMDEVTKLAVALPRHRVVPYPNIPKKHYQFSKEK